MTEGLYAAGFGSSGRFYEASDRALGMKPTTLQKGGKAMRIEFAVGESTLGSVLVARSERGVCAILLGDDPAALAQDLERRFPAAALVAGDVAFAALVARVVCLVEAPGTAPDLPLDVRGTAFQQRVWEALRRIPAGSTATYTELAEVLHSPKSVRAVAQACAANPLAVVVPCHRVVRSDGGLAGYRWGLERKRALLAREGKQPGPGTSLPLF